VATSRLKSEYKLDVRTGPVRVAYRESVADEVEMTSAHPAVLGEKAPKAPKAPKAHADDGESCIRLTMRVEPVGTEPADGARARGGAAAGAADGGGHAALLRIEHEARRGLGPRELRAVREGVAAAAAYGHLLGYPLHGVRATILELRRPRGAGVDALRSAAASALTEAVAVATPRLLEPLMRLEVRRRNRIAIASQSRHSHTAITP
jgi:translation elongation factor EF-G